MKSRRVALLAVFALISSFGLAAAPPKIDHSDEIKRQFKRSPETFELTLMTHYSDNDFGFHVQTATLPKGDYLYPVHQISKKDAAAIAGALSKTPFATKAKAGKSDQRFRPQIPKPAKRVYSITLHCGDFKFFEDVQSKADMKKRVAVIVNALKQSNIGDEFKRDFQAKLEK